MSMNKNDKILLFWTLALIPVVDFLNGSVLLLINKGDISIGKFYRIFTMVILTWILYRTSSKREIKKHIKVYIGIIVCTIFYLGIFYLYHSSLKGVFKDGIEISKMILVFLIFYVLNFLSKKGSINKKNIDEIFNKYIFIFPLTMLIPYTLGIGFNTYSNGMGYTGLFYANNDLSIVMLVTVIFALDKVVKKVNIINVIMFTLNLVSLIIIGSKTGILGLGIGIVIYLIVYSIKIYKEDKYSKKQLIIAGISLIFLSVVIIMIFMPIIEKTLDRFIYFTKKNGSVLTALLSDRNKFAVEAWNNLMQENLWFIKLMLGVGFTYRLGWGKGSLIEMDIVDIFFSLGLIFATVLIIAIVTYLIKNRKKANVDNLRYIVSLAMVVGFSTIAGHVLYSAFAGSVAALLLAGFSMDDRKNKQTETNKIVNEDNKIYDTKISVVVPVYNVEEYIEECIESILYQSLRDIQIIVVDDGSTDNSIEKIKKYKDERIKVITKENGGLSSARNTGLKNAKGKYILFIDSDDFISSRIALEELYCTAEDTAVDIVVGNAVKYYSDEKQEKLFKDNEILKQVVWDSNEYLIEAINRDSMQIPVPFNMYKTELLVRNNLIFKEGRLHEDQLFTPQAFLKADKIAIYQECFYAYRQRSGSIMSGTKKELSYKSAVKNCFELEEIYLKIQDEELRNVLLNKSVSQLLYSCSRNKIKKIKPREIKFLVRNAKTIKNRVKVIIFLLNRDKYYKMYNRKIEN